MERFVKLVVSGGLTLVAGLWLVRFGTVRSTLWLGGLVLIVSGLAGLGVGIGQELSPDW